MPSIEQQALSMVPNLRALAAFIRSNNRMPTREEMRNYFNASGDLSGTMPGTAEYDQQLSYLEGRADFIEENHRFPTEAEMPDPF